MWSSGAFVAVSQHFLCTWAGLLEEDAQKEAGSSRFSLDG